MSSTNPDLAIREEAARAALNETLLFAEQSFEKWGRGGALPPSIANVEASAL